MANPYKKAEQKPKVTPGSNPASRPLDPSVQGPVEAPVVPAVAQKELEPKDKNKMQELVVPVVQQPVEPKIEEMKQEVVAPVKEETPVEHVKENEIIETKTKDLFAGLVEEKPRGKTTGFYLDEEVIAALDKVAKKNKTTKSKVLNTLLRNLLIDNK